MAFGSAEERKQKLRERAESMGRTSALKKTGEDIGKLQTGRSIDFASKFISEKEGGGDYLKGGEYSVYEDPVVMKNTGKSLPTVGPGLTGASMPEQYRNMQVGQKIGKDVIGGAFREKLSGLDTRLTEEFGDKYSGLAPQQRAATMSLVYNVGMKGFKTGGKSEEFMRENPDYTTKAYAGLKAGGREGHQQFVSEAFDRQKGFVRSGGNWVRGLANRRESEQQLWASGTSPDDRAMDDMVSADRRGEITEESLTMNFD